MTRDFVTQQIKHHLKDKGLSRIEVTFEYGKKGAFSTCRTHIVKSYGGVGNVCSFAVMKMFSDLLKTDEINIENEDSMPGCETCDYGSYDECDIVCYNIDLGDPNSDDEDPFSHCQGKDV